MAFFELSEGLERVILLRLSAICTPLMVPANAIVMTQVSEGYFQPKEVLHWTLLSLGCVELSWCHGHGQVASVWVLIASHS